MRINSFEDLAFLQQRQRAAEATAIAELREMYKGSDMSDWWGGVQRVLKQKIGEYTKKEGKEGEIRALSTFKQTWDANPIGGSVSKSTLRVLASAANQASSQDELETANFFSQLRDRLNRVIASKEELPAIPSSTGKLPGGHKPPAGNFGAQKLPPTANNLTQNPDAEKATKEKEKAKLGGAGGAKPPGTPLPTP